jgi:PhnB protein
MEVSTYLSFNGDCEAAFQFYKECLGASIGQVFRYRGTPLADQVPADWQDKVMHASVTLGSQVIMGADEPPTRYEEAKGFSLLMHLDDADAAERIFGQLSMNGRVIIPLTKTFWADRFGVVVDPFGVRWQINCGGSDNS